MGRTASPTAVAVCLARQRDSRVPPVARERKGMERAIETLVLALPKGRILAEVMPVINRAGIDIEAAFDDPDSRQLRFKTSDPGLCKIRLRQFRCRHLRFAFGVAATRRCRQRRADGVSIILENLRAARSRRRRLPQFSSPHRGRMPAATIPRAGACAGGDQTSRDHAAPLRVSRRAGRMRRAARRDGTGAERRAGALHRRSRADRHDAQGQRARSRSSRSPT